jgi:hypothetical protein
MSVSPVLGLTLMSASQAQKEAVFNALLIAMDSLFRGSVLSATLATPPTSPAEGDSYVIAASATGAWSGQDHKITFYFNGWQFITPPLQITLYDVATSAFIRYTALNTWTTLPASTVALLNDLTDVSGTPTNNQVLTWVAADAQWEPKNPTFTAALATLSDVTMTPGAGTDGYLVYWNNTDSKFELKAPPTIPTVTVLGATDLESGGRTTGNIMVYDGSGTPAVKFVAPTSITSVASLSNVGDVSYSGLASGDVLTWNGVAWSGVAGSGYSLTIKEAGTNQDTAAVSLNFVGALVTAASHADTITISLAHLSDFTGTPGAGTDGYTVNWNNTDSKFELVAPVTGGGGGGGSALTIANNGASVDTAATTINFIGATSVTTASHDVTVVLPSGGSGGAALLPAQYEQGPFAPPLISSFGILLAASGVTQTSNSVAGRGSQFLSSTGNSAAWLQDASAWGSAWTMTARVIPEMLNGRYPGAGLCVVDTTGKIVSLNVQSQGMNVLNLLYQEWNSIDSFHANVNNDETTVFAPWVRFRLSGGNFYLGFSLDGLVFTEQTVSATAWLGTIASAGIWTTMVSDDTVYVTPSPVGALVTYFDSPSTSAASQEQPTQAVLNDLSDVSATTPSDGDVLTYSASAGKWIDKPAFHGAWQDVAWTSASLLGVTAGSGGAGGYASVATITLAAGQMLELEGYLYALSTVSRSMGVANANGYQLAHNNNGGVTLYKAAGGTWSNLGGGLGTDATINITGKVPLKMRVYCNGSGQNNIVTSEMFGYHLGDSLNNDGVMDTTTSFQIYVATDDITQCAARYRIK